MVVVVIVIGIVVVVMMMMVGNGGFFRGSGGDGVGYCRGGSVMVVVIVVVVVMVKRLAKYNHNVLLFWIMVMTRMAAKMMPAAVDASLLLTDSMHRRAYDQRTSCQKTPFHLLFRQHRSSLALFNEVLGNN